MITNADITIYNRKLNPVTRLPEYHGTQIKSVHWYTDQKISVLDKGVASADIYKIRIPLDADQGSRRYVTAQEYSKLMDVSQVWTTQNQDIAVKGLVDIPIMKMSDLDGYEKAIVISYADNRQGSLPHWRIGGA